MIRNLYINTLRLLLAALCILLVSCIIAAPKNGKPIVVDINGNGDYKSIQAAINSLPDSSVTQRIILIRDGVYKEKIYLEKHNIILKGANVESTIITQDIARDEWRCIHNDDWGVATLNIDGNDITLMNLTIANEYGFNNQEDRNIYCRTDSTRRNKIISDKGHQMALRSFKATRLKAINCYFRSYAGDTVSPWNTVDGMFYFKNCIMEGGVDFYCPRGYAWAENCSFYASRGDAAIWHDGSGNQDHKTVFVDCNFDGYDGFKLGRFHRDAQFFLIDCEFSEAMADKDIFLVSTPNIIKWGKRVYYEGCEKSGDDYAWFADNLEKQTGLKKEKITVDWLFQGKWNPEKN